MSRNSVERFSDRVDDYVKYRPEYPASIIGFLKDEIDFDSTWKVADIGAGTGISSKLFLENGNQVVAVEPNAEMRRAAAVYLADYSSFRLIDSTAENTKLGDKCVDLVTASQAFHWFDLSKCVAEFRRILTEAGYIALIWNERRLNANEFLRQYEKLLVEFGTDYGKVRHDKLTIESMEKAFGSKFFLKSFPNSQTLDFKGFMGRSFSASYTPAKDDHRYEYMLGSLKSLFADFQEKGRIQLLYNTNIFYAQI
ncbi:MAG: class I SAM-dependent methyltransferase [Pyrinomonadaceae bacterium]|nr:class I SAM-dependent methyltransferase [Pyrinomonadaceae bacterium]